MNAGLMDMFKDAMGSNTGSVSKGTWSAEEFQKMVVAIESSGKAGVDVVPNWDDLDHLLRDQESTAERSNYDDVLKGRASVTCFVMNKGTAIT
jgi:hypothetical protein